MLYKNFNDLVKKIGQFALFSKDKIYLIHSTEIHPKLLDELVYNLSLNKNKKIKEAIFVFLRELARKKGIFCSSIYPLYQARVERKCKGFTVPAINFRGFTYYAAQAFFKEAIKKRVGAFILEIARSEIDYTNQSPKEYVGVILAAAIKENFKGPIFFQGDHFQVRIEEYKKDPKKELDALKNIIRKAIQAGFYNIDLDASALVDSTKKKISQQQKLNYEISAELTRYIRRIEPKGITISIGAEVGRIGGKITTPRELRSFLDNYKRKLTSYSKDLIGISKIAVQTGTVHGGIVLSDGKIGSMKVDFRTIRKLSEIAQKEYKLAGIVQHGASTLPDKIFSKFPKVGVLEIHLATAFQNVIFDNFPESLKEKIYRWIKKNFQSEKKPNWTDEQFIYKLRKKSWGHFKKEILDLPNRIKEKICLILEKRFDFLFKALKVENTENLVRKYVREG